MNTGAICDLFGNLGGREGRYGGKTLQPHGHPPTTVKVEHLQEKITKTIDGVQTTAWTGKWSCLVLVPNDANLGTTTTAGALASNTILSKPPTIYPDTIDEIKQAELLKLT